MKKVQLVDAKRYMGPNHYNMVSLKLHGTQETGCQSFWVGTSYVLPGGGVPMQASPVEQVFMVLDGEITFKSMEESYDLHMMDSIYVAANEEREMINNSNKVCTVLVIKGGGESFLKFVE